MQTGTRGGAKTRVVWFISYCMLMPGIAGQVLATPVEEVVTLQVTPDATLRYLQLAPDAPVASVILFAGYDGFINVTERGLEGSGENFLVRSRRLFAEQGFMVAVPDTPSDMRSLLGRRDGERHRGDILHLVAHLQRTAGVPVWVVGTSRGTISAANAAAHPVAAGPAGLVLTATVTERGTHNRGSVYDVALGNITRPSLIVHHRSDDCHVTPYYGAERLTKKLKRAPRVELLGFAGGAAPQSDSCGPLSAHGFYGIEPQVVEAISNWIRGATAALQ